MRFKDAVAVITLFIFALVMAGEGLSARRPAKGARAPKEAKQEDKVPAYQAALLMEADTGSILFEHEIHKKWPPASMVKMMLMFIVMERAKAGEVKLTDLVTASVRASKTGGSQVYLKQGEQFPLEDLMKATVVASANDAAVAIAEHIGGTVEGFVEMMNARAKELGLNDTHYVSVHGLPPEKGQEGDVSSAYDLAVLARKLLQYPDVKRWGAINEDTFRGGKFGLTNTNHLVRNFPGTNGMKTGYFKEAGFNITATAERGGMALIAVILGAPKSQVRFAEAGRLLATGFGGYKKVRAVTKGSAVGPEVPVSKATKKKTQVVAADDLVVVVKRGEEKDIAVKLDKIEMLEAPVKKGQAVGQLSVLLKGQVVARGVAVASEEIPRASFFRRLLPF